MKALAVCDLGLVPAAAVQDAAQRVIEDAEITRLNREDFAALLRALDVDPAPSEALRAAAARYRALADHA